MFGGLLFLGLLVAVVVWLASGRQSPSTSMSHSRDVSTADRPNPLDIVRERYARGEITREEYQRLQDDLRS